jgi:ketosteroid isomerase-like protein
MVTKSQIFLFVLAVSLISCLKENRNSRNKEYTQQFFKVYADHNDFDQFISYYADNTVLEDIINGDRIEGKDALKIFFDWDNPNLIRKSSKALVMQELIVEGQQAVIKGYFTPFEWQTTPFEAMHFTTILTFNDDGKIIKHVDWINYPASLVDYQNRKNSNDWINNL